MLVAPSHPVFAKAEKKPRSGTKKNYMILLEINKRLLKVIKLDCLYVVTFDI